MNLSRIVFSVLALSAALLAQEGAQTKSSFYPVSVWYSGGKARAPMLEQVSGESARLWKEDLLKIRGLGFNTVRTWVEWNVGEPQEGQYHLENLDLLLRLADEVGIESDRAGLCRFCSGVGGNKISGWSLCSAGWTGDPLTGCTRILL